MSVLIIDATSTHLLVGLSTEKGIIESVMAQGMVHQEHIMVLIDSLLKTASIERSELSKIIVSHGPGSFTGIRVGLSAAKGIALALSIPMVQVNCVDALGMQFKTNALYTVVFDAKKASVYAAHYEYGKRIGEIIDLSIIELPKFMEEQNSRLIFLGPEIDFANLSLGQEIISISVRSWIYGLWELGKNLSLDEALNGQPFYIRESDADLGVAPPRK